MLKRKSISFSVAPNADEHFQRTTKTKSIKVRILYIECIEFCLEQLYVSQYTVLLAE